MPLLITSLENPVTILIILVIILILFGAKRIPEVMHGLGRGLSEFKRGAGYAEQDLHRSLSSAPPAEETKSTPTESAPSAEATSEEKPG